MLNSTGPVGTWHVSAAAGAVEVESLHVRLPEEGEPSVSPSPDVFRRRLETRLRALRLEAAPTGRLSAAWHRAPDVPPWPGTWTAEPNGTAAGSRYRITADGGRHSTLDGLLLVEGDRARLDALFLAPGNGGTWPTVARTRIAMTLAAPAQAGDPGDPAQPWERTFTGTIAPVTDGTGLHAHGVRVDFGPRPGPCRGTTRPAMALYSLAPLADGALLWIAHCADTADFTRSGPPGAETAFLTVDFGPRHEDDGAPVWNVPHPLPVLTGCALPLKAAQGRARLTLRGQALTGTVELAARDPFTEEPRTYRAQLEAVEPTAAEPAPPPAADTAPDTAPDRTDTEDNSSLLRFFAPLQLTVGLERATGADDGRPPRIVLMQRTEPAATPELPEGAWHDRMELRDTAQQLVLAQRYVEARPLLRRALTLYEDAAASAATEQLLTGEQISMLLILEHQILCDAALNDHEALVERLSRSAEMRAALLTKGRGAAGHAPYTPELVAGTLKAMLGKTQYGEYWRSMLDNDAERVAQLQATAPFHDRLARALMDLGEPDAALLAAEAGRGRAFADLVGRAVPRAERAQRTWVFGAPPPLNGEQLRLLLNRHGHPAVVYHLGGDLLMRWTAVPDGTIVAHTQRLDRDALARAVDRARLGHPDTGLGRLLWPSGVDRLLPDDPDSPVTVVPHGVLSRVPFAALPDSRGRPLVLRHALTVLPALSLLTGLLDRRAVRQEEAFGPDRLLAFVAPEPLPGGLQPLTQAGEWFPAVAEAYGTHRSTVHYGRDATAVRLAREAADASVLCFATHVEARDGSDGTDPLDSYVALAATPGHDGRLRASRLPDLRIGADLVVLAACRSGIGRPTADGVVGLARSFLVRGPTALLMTLAPVHEDDALEIVLRFFEGWLHEGRTRAAALRRAQLDLALNHPGNPERWASFALLGLGGRGVVPPETGPFRPS